MIREIQNGHECDDSWTRECIYKINEIVSNVNYILDRLPVEEAKDPNEE